MMAIRDVVTRGFGNGTYDPGVNKLPVRGYSIGAAVSITPLFPGDTITTRSGPGAASTSRGGPGAVTVTRSGPGSVSGGRKKTSDV